MKKLTYKKITDSIIEIDLQNGYTVIAVIIQNKEENIYKASLYLRDNETSLYDLMGDFEHLKFDTTYRTIHSVILKEIASLLEAGKFNRYFDRYEYMLQCFDRGNGFYEQERKGNFNAM